VQNLLSTATQAGARVRTIEAAEAVAALAPDTIVITDGEVWATAQLAVPDGSAMVQVVDGTLLPGLARRPSRVSFAHSVSQALDEARPGRVTAVLLPAVDLDLVMALVRESSRLPEKATSFQPKPSLGSFIRLLDE
jgi:hypothetical protein